MPKIWNLPHLFIQVGYNPAKFQSPRTVVIPFKGKSRENLTAHIDGLLDKLKEVFLSQSQVSVARRSQSLPAPKGIYLEILVDSNFPMEQLESRDGKIKVRNVRPVDGFKAVLVYLQNGHKSKFIQKLEKYKATLDNINPEQKRFAESVEVFRNAVIDAFWTDDPLEIPQETKIWCEVWLEVSTDKYLREFKFNRLKQVTLPQLNIEFKPEIVLFPERLIFLARLDRADFEILIQMVDELAEIRLAREATSFWTGLSRGEQAEAIEELLSRVEFIADSPISVLVLDTGINHGHPLLQPFINPDFIYNEVRIQNAVDVIIQT